MTRDYWTSLARILITAAVIRMALPWLVAAALLLWWLFSSIR